MDSQKIYILANKLTKEQLFAIVKSWKDRNEIEKLRLYNSLISLGDSKELACATVIFKKAVSDEVLKDYRFAYES